MADDVNGRALKVEPEPWAHSSVWAASSARPNWKRCEKGTRTGMYGWPPRLNLERTEPILRVGEPITNNDPGPWLAVPLRARLERGNRVSCGGQTPDQIMHQLTGAPGEPLSWYLLAWERYSFRGAISLTEEIAGQIHRSTVRRSRACGRPDNRWIAFIQLRSCVRSHGPECCSSFPAKTSRICP